MTFPSTQADHINSVLSEATADPHHGVPRAVLLVASRDSPLVFSAHSGYAQLPQYPCTKDDLEKAEKISPDSIFELWSCTKLVTSIAGMQLVENGTIGLDDDASKWVPELKEQKVYEGLDEQGKVKTKPIQNKVTIRMLLTHTAGLTYDYYPPYAEAAKALGLPNVYSTKSSKDSFLAMPFMFEPGTRWSYGTSLDYLALVIEAATGKPLIEYFKENIFGPLGISDLSYDPPANRINMAYDDPADPAAPWKAGPGVTLKANRGGAGLFGSPRSYLKIVRALLSSDGRPLFKHRSTLDMMFEEQLHSDEMRKGLYEFVGTGADPWTTQIWDEGKGRVYEGMDHGLAGSLAGEGNEGGRSKGTMNWSGYCNTFWVCDRTKGVAYVLFTNSTPTYAHPRWFDVWRKIEREIFEGAAAVVKSSANPLETKSAAL